MHVLGNRVDDLVHQTKTKYAKKDEFLADRHLKVPDPGNGKQEDGEVRDKADGGGEDPDGQRIQAPRFRARYDQVQRSTREAQYDLLDDRPQRYDYQAPSTNAAQDRVGKDTPVLKQE